ncbi:hypothetical protein E2C01_054343 [Portunus trituberculatus]|uniref:Uncharacterized protein n=1 Tax=Portunus trituberculatus TaxID=210409 RepID=A0A5B7GN82_PORTR|nr:hypothetical protein [Portunus trituberculatus]
MMTIPSHGSRVGKASTRQETPVMKRCEEDLSLWGSTTHGKRRGEAR